MDLSQLFLGSVPVSVLVYIVTETVKEFSGWTGNRVRYLAGALSVLFASIPLYVLPAYPLLEPWFKGMAICILIWGGSTAIFKLKMLR